MPIFHSHRPIPFASVRPSSPSSPRRGGRVPFILGVTAAVMLPALGFGQGTGGRTVTYTGQGTNDNLQVVTNWVGSNAAAVPDWSDNEGTGSYRFAGTDAILFPSLSSLTPGGQTRLNPILAVTNNNNLGATTYTLRAVTFAEGAGGYTFTAATGLSLTLGDSTDPVENPQNSGLLSNSSLSAQTFNLPVRFRFGTVDAAAGPIVFGQTVNVGNNLVDAVNNLTVSGSSTVTVTGALLGNGTETSLGGALIKEGTGALILNGNSAAWNGRIVIKEGVVQVGSGNALGSAIGRTTLAGETATGRVQFGTLSTGTTVIGENFFLGGRSLATTPHLVNTAGNFNLTGNLILEEGGTEYGLTSESGLLTVSGAINYGSAAGETNLHLSGASEGVLSSNLGAAAPGISVIKEGSGTWTLSGANTYTGATQVNAGRLNIKAGQTGGGDVLVGDLATLGINLGAPGQTLNAASFTLGSGVGGTLAFDLGNFGTPTLPVITTSSLTINGTSTIALQAGGLSVGLVPLIDYSG
ncbi:MAG: rane protein, partial [Chthoniobacteraceae bacterium]|nr:rane protein [Chthoniobacteraceae bacterium]